MLKTLCPFQQLLDTALNQVYPSLFPLRLSYPQRTALSRKMKDDAKSTQFNTVTPHHALSFFLLLKTYGPNLYSVHFHCSFGEFCDTDRFFVVVVVVPKAMVRGKKPQQTKKQIDIDLHAYIYTHKVESQNTKLKDGKFLQSSQSFLFANKYNIMEQN